MSLEKTRKALAEYDVLDDELRASFKFTSWDSNDSTTAELLAIIKRLEVLGAAVGAAFGLDTGQNTEKCQACVRPGPKNPSPGCELSIVRRMVAKEIQREGGETDDD